MAKRVQTGCPNCKRCTNSAVGEGARKAGRAYVALATGGLSEAARAGTRNCRACGHKMSLHTPVAAVTPVPVVVPTPPAASAPPSLSSLASGDPRTAAEWLDGQAEKAQAKAAEWEAKAASYEGKINGKMRAANARKTAERLRKIAERQRERAENAWAQVDVAIEESLVIESGSTPEAAPDLSEQLARLAELNASGALTDEEFAAAKARLLGQ